MSSRSSPRNTDADAPGAQGSTPMLASFDGLLFRDRNAEADIRPKSHSRLPMGTRAFAIPTYAALGTQGIRGANAAVLLAVPGGRQLELQCDRGGK
jgi:hypothetical protein